MGKTPDIGSFKDETSAEFAGDGEIENVRVGSLESVVQPPVDGKGPGTRPSRGSDQPRKRGGRRAHHLLAAKARVCRRQGEEARKARRAIYLLRAGGVHQGGGQAEGALPVEGVYDALAEVVEVDAVTASDRALAGAPEQRMHKSAAPMRRVRKSDSWSEVLVVPGPVRLLAVPLPGKGHLHQPAGILRVKRFSLCHVYATLGKPVIQADRGRYLVAMNLIGRLQQRVPHAASEHQVRCDAPGVLKVELALVAFEIAGDQLSGIEKVPRLVLIVDLVGFGEQTGNCSSRKVIIGGPTGVDRRISTDRGIQTDSSACESGDDQPVHICLGPRIVHIIAGAVVADDAQIAAKLERMLTFGPAHIVHDIVDRNIGKGGGRETRT